MRLEVLDARQSHATVANRTKRDGGYGVAQVGGPIMGIPLNQECPGMFKSEMIIFIIFIILSKTLSKRTGRGEVERKGGSDETEGGGEGGEKLKQVNAQNVKRKSF